MAARRKNATPMIGLHLDLKGVMFKPSYIPQLMADMAGQGINTVLVEYEDIFPFQGMDIACDRSVVWSRRTLATFLAEAARQRIEVIPLQQCLAHLEYLFRWRRYRRLAENPKYASTLCVSNASGKRLVIGMLRQVLEAHPRSRYVHLGMDEAFALPSCPECRARGDVLSVFLQHLRDLCDVCDEYGKTPIIWSDMLEDHFRPEAFADIKDRVILACWDYSRHDEVDYLVRIGGWRVSREWLDQPENPEAPPISEGTQFLEDLPADVQKVLAPYRRGLGCVPLFFSDLWTRLGFRLIGSSAVRFSALGPVLSDPNHLRSNMTAWVRSIKRTGQIGVIATSWARGTTHCPPGFSTDLTWPDIGFLARAMGAKPRTFWPGIAPRTADRIVRQLGRCRKDWRLEAKIAREMKKLLPKLKAHRYEWESWMLMARMQHWQRRAEFAQLESDFFDANIRPIESEWRRRLDDQKAILQDLVTLRKRVRSHFGRRYYGEAFEEWIRELFGLHERRLRESRIIAQRKLQQARKVYARHGDEKRRRGT